MEIALQNEIVIIQDLAQLGGEALAVKQIGDAQRAPRDLVFVGRTDSPAGGADGIRALRLFTGAVECHMGSENQRAGRAHLQALEHRYALADQSVRFLEQRFQRQHHAIADEALDAGVQDSRRDERENGLLAADHQRMPGVVSALEARHGLHLIGQQIDDLALAFVAPLQSDHDEVFTHCAPSTAEQGRPPC